MNLQVLLTGVSDFASSHASLPLHSVQFGFWSYNVTCLLCHSNVANRDVNAARRGDLVLSVIFRFRLQDESEAVQLLETVSDN